ncbi:MAG: hypothetical protein HY553_15890 [Elusimicrobia bacterium]|nr:hypothetical protein [Elusimicrobiota bacterium]
MDTTPAPPAERINIAPESAVVQLKSAEVPTELVLARTLEYIPRGLSHSLFAPFPWQIRRPVDVLPLPEMVVWYVCLAAATATLLRRWRSWRELLLLGAFSFGMLLLLALVEGNVGTLYRHRGMATPWILVLSTPVLSDVVIRSAASLRSRPVFAAATATDAG